MTKRACDVCTLDIPEGKPYYQLTSRSEVRILPIVYDLCSKKCIIDLAERPFI